VDQVQVSQRARQKSRMKASFGSGVHCADPAYHRSRLASRCVTRPWTHGGERGDARRTRRSTYITMHRRGGCM
jgi:hypothetical protein